MSVPPQPPNGPARPICLPVLLAFAICAGGCGTTSARRGPSAPSPGTRAMHGSRTRFAVERTRRGPDDALPAQVLETLSQSASPTFTAADELAARRVLANSPAWLVPASDGEACLIRIVQPLVRIEEGRPLPPSVSLICLPEQAAQSGQLVETQSLSLGSANARWYRVVGVVPDTAREIEIVSAHDTRMAITAVRNAYEAVVRDPRAVRFLTGRRRRQHVVSIGTGAEVRHVTEPAG